mmetsp:Transcript_13843/g.58202  ORF Transcript_13843/g.58202 Transcript_13843/m.58202 type:complete len:378 (+) Transcript_13843:156-1289(+)
MLFTRARGKSESFRRHEASRLVSAPRGTRFFFTTVFKKKSQPALLELLEFLLHILGDVGAGAPPRDVRAPLLPVFVPRRLAHRGLLAHLLHGHVRHRHGLADAALLEAHRDWEVQPRDGRLRSRANAQTRALVRHAVRERGERHDRGTFVRRDRDVTDGELSNERLAVHLGLALRVVLRRARRGRGIGKKHAHERAALVFFLIRRLALERVRQVVRGLALRGVAQRGHLERERAGGRGGGEAPLRRPSRQIRSLEPRAVAPHELLRVIHELAEPLRERGHVLAHGRGKLRGHVHRLGVAHELRAPLGELGERIRLGARHEVGDGEHRRVDVEHAQAAHAEVHGQEPLRERPQVRLLVLGALCAGIQPASLQDVRREL